jgi:hypothetical protein
MNPLPPVRFAAAAAAIGFASLPATAGACSICMGDVNSRFAPAANDAIFLMLGCIGFMMLSIVGCAFYFVRRAKTHVPPDAGLGDTSADAAR